MNPFLEAFLRGASFRNMNSTYVRVRLSSLALASGASFAVGSGIELFVDTDQVFGSLTYPADAKITFDPTSDRTLTATQIMGDGLWQISAADGVNQFTHRARIILMGARGTHTPRPNHPSTGIAQGATNDGLSRGFNNHGTVYWRGIPCLLIKTKLAASTTGTTITVRGDCSDWKQGNDIAIAPTNLYGQSTSERRTLASDGVYNAGTGRTTLTLTAALGELHYGLKQYPIDAAYGVNAMSLTPGTFTPPDADTPTEFDSSAEVINLSSGNISVESVLDSDWSTYGFGVHIMDHPGSQYRYEGVRVIRGGQRGALGRYPFHAHYLSYSDRTGAVTFESAAGVIKVNWANHGIAPSKINGGTVTFSFDPSVWSGALVVNTTGVQRTTQQGMFCTFTAGAGSSLPSNITPGTVYFLGSAGTDRYVVCTAYTTDINQQFAPRLTYVNSGSGSTNAVNCNDSTQPVAFTSTGTLPLGLAQGYFDKPIAQFYGSKYPVIGSTITANSFYINVAPGAGAGSGTHTGRYTAFTADHPECQRVGCVVDTSENRGFVTHGTCGTRLTDCYTFDTKGNTFFLEDMNEERNVFTRCFALKVRNPAYIDAPKDFDAPDPNSFNEQRMGSAGHWWVNMNNQFIDCQAADCQGSAVIQAPGPQCFDLGSLTDCVPNTRPVLRWLNNGGHSNRKNGLVLTAGIDDQFGRSSNASSSSLYGDPAVNALGYPGNLFEGLIAWKNNQGGYQNVENPEGPFYKGALMADNPTGGFQGAMNPALMNGTSMLLIGASLLPAATADVAIDLIGFGPYAQFGNATYHWSLIFMKIAYQNFQWSRGYYKRGGQQDDGGGAQSHRDLYTQAVALQRVYAIGNKYNNSHPGHLTRCDRYGGYPVTVTLGGTLVVSPNITNGTTGGREFPLTEGDPLRFVRSTGALPSGGSLGGDLQFDVPYYAKNVRDGAGTLTSTLDAGASCNLSRTPGGAAINGTGAAQSGNHSMMRMCRTPGVYWIRGMGSIMPDPEGNFIKAKTGTAPGTYQWVCPYSDKPFFASGARNIVLIDPAGAGGLDGLSFSTTDFFVGLEHVTTDGDAGSFGGFGYHLGMRVSRVTPTTRTLIDKYEIDKIPMTASGEFFSQNQTSALLNIRGSQTWYTVESGCDPDGTNRYVPTGYMGVSLIGGNNPDADMMIGLKLNAAPSTVFRTFAINVTPSGPDGSAGRSVVCTAATGADDAAKLAAVATSANGSLYFYDTATKFVWVRHRPLPNNSAALAADALLRDSDPNKAWQEQWIVAKT